MLTLVKSCQANKRSSQRLVRYFCIRSGPALVNALPCRCQGVAAAPSAAHFGTLVADRHRCMSGFAWLPPRWQSHMQPVCLASLFVRLEAFSEPEVHKHSTLRCLGRQYIVACLAPQYTALQHGFFQLSAIHVSKTIISSTQSIVKIYQASTKALYKVIRHAQSRQTASNQQRLPTPRWKPPPRARDGMKPRLLGGPTWDCGYTMS